MTIELLKKEWRNEPEYHVIINDIFRSYTDDVPQLKEHRDWVEQNIFGFGERAFWWLWKLICDELPEKPTLLEIGVFKSATLSLWGVLRPDAHIIGISSMNGDGTGWTDDDYYAHRKTISDRFNNGKLPLIIEGYSTNPVIIEAASALTYDVVYVDGGHSYETALSDLTHYAPFVKVGGYLVIDDAASDLNFPPTGFFTGIADVVKAKQDWLATNPPFEFICNVVHLVVYRRV